MAFIVINIVEAAKEDLPGVIENLQQTGLDALRAQPGFRMARLLVAEDQSEAKMIIEWENREAFIAYRQSELGKKAVERAVRMHPRIEFYEVVASSD